MAEPPLLTLQDIRLTFGGTPLLEGADLLVGQRDRICLIGRNGSGKSTLLRIAAGAVAADGGARFLQPSATLRYLPQEPDPAGFPTARAFALAGLGPGDDPHRADALLASLGLTGEEDPARLSGGELRRAAIVQALAAEPDILLLDEPTNHLDLPAIEWLEERLRAHRGALVFVSHDRRFLEALSSATVWIDRGRTRRLDKGFAAFEAWRDAVLEEEELAGHKLDRKIAREADWLRYGVSARRKRNMRRLGALHTLRAERRQMLSRGPVGEAALSTEAGPRSGKLVIEASGITKSYGGRAVVRDVSIRIARGDRLGVIGPNGSGKTTLVNLLTGRLAPDAGTVRLGANVEMVTLDQTRESLDPDVSLADTLTEGRGDSVQVGSSQRHVIGYMRDFLFVPEQAGTPVGRLSGGERARLMLARALARRSNLMVLDEPTNDLDLETLDLLQDFLADYDGTLILISHDRD
ncbi:MAG: ABC-F family ATP-binding cassette domain-containing protein, partial [Pseudolabrys sp.]|nr:ABC-F family ATP-binding cassette domain-containing protein [Pseudolabrys sp.]